MSALKNIFIKYPGSMIRLITNGAEISSKIKKAERDKDWYFSQEGIDAYNALSTLGQKITFFCEYLRLIAKKPDYDRYDHDRHLHYIAFVMANSMVDSKLEFGGYPNVIDTSKNPIVLFIKYYDIITDSKFEPNYCGTYLCLLHNGAPKDESKYTYEDRPFERLTYCEPGEELSDMYKIERDIISLFGFSPYENDKYDGILVPYVYSIIPGDEDDE